MRAAPLVTLVLLVVAWFANRRRKNAVKPVDTAPLAEALTPGDAFSQLQHTDWRNRKQAVEVLAGTSDASLIPAFVQRLSDTDDDVRHAARVALEGFGSAAVEPLVQVLQARAWEPAEQAAQALGHIGGAAAAAALSAALTHGSAWVRSAAARALGDMRSETAVPALVQALDDDEDLDVCQVVIAALRQIGTPEALQAIGG